jgi:hypothetical protein
VETGSRKVGRVAEYVCHRRRHNGTYTNALRIPAAKMKEAVLQAAEEQSLRRRPSSWSLPAERDELRERQDALRTEYRDVERRIARLTSVLETEGAISPRLSPACGCWSSERPPLPASWSRRSLCLGYRSR